MAVPMGGGVLEVMVGVVGVGVVGVGVVVVFSIIRMMKDKDTRW